MEEEEQEREGRRLARKSSDPDPEKPRAGVDLNELRTRVLRNQAQGPGLPISSDNLLALSPSEFESLISHLLNSMGFERILSNTLGDSGSDLIALDPNYVTGGKVLVQAKRYSHPVPVEAVRSLYGAVLDTGAMKGIRGLNEGQFPSGNSG